MSQLFFSCSKPSAIFSIFLKSQNTCNTTFHKFSSVELLLHFFYFRYNLYVSLQSINIGGDGCDLRIQRRNSLLLLCYFFFMGSDLMFLFTRLYRLRFTLYIFSIKMASESIPNCLQIIFFNFPHDVFPL